MFPCEGGGDLKFTATLASTSARTDPLRWVEVWFFGADDLGQAHLDMVNERALAIGKLEQQYLKSSDEATTAMPLVSEAESTKPCSIAAYRFEEEESSNSAVLVIDLAAMSGKDAAERLPVDVDRLDVQTSVGVVTLTGLGGDDLRISLPEGTTVDESRAVRFSKKRLEMRIFLSRTTRF